MQQDATQPTAATDETQPEAETQPSSNMHRLNELRQVEETRRGEDQHLRVRMAATGAIIGIMVAAFVGFVGIAISIVDDGVGDFGFKFFRPNLTTFFRIITAYAFSGAVAGAGLTYLIFQSRRAAANPALLLLSGVANAIATPLLIGLTLPLTFLIFVDFFEGLRPGLWLSAFVEVFLGSFLDGYVYMISIVYAGLLGGLVFIVLTALSGWFWIKQPFGAAFGNDNVKTGVYATAIAVIAAVPFLAVAFGPIDILRSITQALTGENII